MSSAAVKRKIATGHIPQRNEIDIRYNNCLILREKRRSRNLYIFIGTIFSRCCSKFNRHCQRGASGKPDDSAGDLRPVGVRSFLDHPGSIFRLVGHPKISWRVCLRSPSAIPASQRLNVLGGSSDSCQSNRHEGLSWRRKKSLVLDIHVRFV